MNEPPTEQLQPPASGGSGGEMDAKIDDAQPGLETDLKHGEGLAKRLLQSTDAKVAAAARRIFCGGSSAVASGSGAAVPTTQLPTMALGVVAGADGTAQVAAPAPPAGVPAQAGQGVQPTALAVAASAAIVKTCVMGNDTTGPSETSDVATAGEGGEHHASKGGGTKATSSERLQRSRERNRMHARKTRQRKKEHMQALQGRADELKTDQVRLKQAINEKNTASILLGMFSCRGVAGPASQSKDVDPKVDELMKRAPEDIPDASKIPELPALILPGQHSNKRKKAMAAACGDGAESPRQGPQHKQIPDDGIDYELLGKDRSKCTPAELDRIRRERNRMHAKRTRDRKRIFMEEMEVIIKQLEDENSVLQEHLDSLNIERARPDDATPITEPNTPSIASVSPAMQPVASPLLPVAIADETPSTVVNTTSNVPSTPVGLNGNVVEDKLSTTKQQGGVTVDQIKTLLAAAGAFDQKENFTGMVTISSVAAVVAASDDEDGSVSPRPTKRQCVKSPPPSSSVTTSAATISC